MRSALLLVRRVFCRGRVGLPASANKSGFTLLEIVLTIPLLALASIFIGVAIWSTITNFRLNSAAYKLLHDVRLTQQQAISKGAWYGINFQIDPTNHYTVYQTDGSTDTPIADPSNNGASLVVDTHTDYDVLISAVNIDGGVQVEFNPRGVPYVDKNGAAIIESGTVTLSRGTSTKTLVINKQTGKAALQ